MKIFPHLLFGLVSLSLGFAQSAATPTTEPTPVEKFLRPPEPGRFKPLFQPFRTNQATISPDGKHIAYSVRTGDILSIVVIESERPDVIKSHVKVISDESATPMLARDQAEKTPARIEWMRWVTPSRLVIGTNKTFTKSVDVDPADSLVVPSVDLRLSSAERPNGKAWKTQWQNWRGTVMAVDVDSTNAQEIVDLREIAEFGGGEGSMSELTKFFFSTGREPPFDWRSKSGENNGPLLPDQDSRTGAKTDDQIADDSSALDPDAESPTATGSRAANISRSLEIFDQDPRKPATVNLLVRDAPRVAGLQPLGFYTLDAQSGQLHLATESLVPTAADVLVDRQGSPRLTLPNNFPADFPLSYSYYGPKGKTRARPLDTVTGLTGFTLSPDNYFGERSIPLGFDENPQVLYYASNVGRDTFGIYSFDLGSNRPGKLAIENPTADLISAPTAAFPPRSMLVFDRYTSALIGVRCQSALRSTAWLRPELQQLQGTLEKKFPGRSVEILDWDQAGTRFVFATESPADPGAFYLLDLSAGKILEFVRRAPWVDTNHTPATLPFSYSRNDGTTIAGLVTVPRQPRLKPIPMLVVCPETPWQFLESNFQTEIKALADMGFVIVQFNGRGAWGTGRKHREALTAGYDLIQVDDIVTTLAQLEKQFAVNLNRVALLGRGHGGFIALRALQEHPEKFRCAVAIDAPVDLAEWLKEARWNNRELMPQLTRRWLGDEMRLKAAPLVRAPEKITKPVLFLNYRGIPGEPSRPIYLAARRFARRVAELGGHVDTAELNTDYMQGLPAARGEAFEIIEGFLNEHVYSPNVKLRTMTYKDESSP